MKQSDRKARRPKKRTKPPVEFHVQDRIGKAGERAVETFIEERIGFAYRRVDSPDIGIDGEIEIFDRQGIATGGFLKAQVKTTGESLAGKRIRVPMDEAHLDYYDSLTVPAVLFIVSRADDMIWWKPILHKENYRGPKGGFGVPLNCSKDLLAPFSATLLRMVGDRSNAIIAGYLIEEVHEQLTDMDDEEATDNFDLVTVQAWAERLALIDGMMRDAWCLLRYERRYSDRITEIEGRYAEAQDRIVQRKIWFEEWNCLDVLDDAGAERVD